MMGWAEPPSSYDTNKSPVKKVPTFQRDKIKVVKDPLAETKYAYHINYHGDETSDDPTATNTLGSNGAVPQDEQSLQRGANQSRRVGFVGDDGVFVMGPPPENSHYMNDPHMVGLGDRSVTIPYDPNSYVKDEGFDYETAKDNDSQKSCRKCSIPPWWAWLIIILVTCLLVAVLYFIFGKLFKNSTENGAMPMLSPVLNGSTTQIMDLPGKISTIDSGQAALPPSTLPPSTHLQDPTLIRLFGLFMPMEDTQSLPSIHSSHRPLSPAKTAEDCLQACLDHSTKACFGVDFDKQDKTCHLLTLYDYTLESLGAAPGRYNYRRTFESKSFCHGSLVYNLHNTFTASVSFKSVPNGKTLPECQQACLGPHGNGLLENGYRCTAGVFTASGQCLITDVKYDPGSTLHESKGSTHFINDGLKCSDGNKTACSIQFTVQNNQHPSDLNTTLQQPGPLSLPECGDKCVDYLSISGVACTGFVYNYTGKNCTLYTGDPAGATKVAPNSDFYRHVKTKCDRCGYVLHTATSGSRRHSPDDVPTPHACAERCTPRSPACYGFDLMNKTGTSEKRCHVITDAGSRLTGSSNTDHHAWDPACRDCNPTEFISTLHTAPDGGSPVGRRTKAGCSRACQEAVSSWEEGKRCYGFTYNTVTNNCTLFYDFGYELTNIGTDMESMHYRRTFTCTQTSSSCDKYDLTADTKATSSGHFELQPWDINSVSRCKDRCEGYGLTTNLTCQSLDFNRRTARCTIFLDEDLSMGLVGKDVGVDHYKRNTC